VILIGYVRVVNVIRRSLIVWVVETKEEPSSRATVVKYVILLGGTCFAARS
jgi:hypothetical protein